MAEKPSVGSTNWGVALNANLAVGHAADGTHNEAGMVRQVVNVMDGAVDTGTTQMVGDDSIPQNTEGDEYMTLAITPKSVTNKLKIEVVAVLSNSSAATHSMLVALFQDAGANAIAGAI